MSKFRFDQIAINSTTKKKPVEEDKYTYIGLGHLDSGNLNVARWGAEVAPIGEKLLMKKDDVLFGKRRAYQKKVAIAPFDGIFSAHGMVLRPKEDVIDKDFFPMFISSDYFLDTAIAISVGSLSPTINWKDLAKLEFEVPPLEEQKKLAAVLWSINDTLQAYQDLLKQTDELVKAQFIEMFGSADNPSNDCEYLALNKICKKESSNLSMKAVEKIDGEYPLFGATGYIKCIDTFKIDKPYVAIIKDGAGVGRVQLLPACSSIINTMQYIVPNEDIIPEYLAELLSIMDLGKDRIGSTIPHIYFKNYGERIVPKPQMYLQEIFATFVEQCNKSKDALLNAKVAACEMKRSILEDAFRKG